MIIEYSKEATKYIEKLNKPTKLRLKRAIEKLLYKPPQGDIKSMQGQKDLYRLRVGDLRILFSINENNDIIIISKVAPRGEVYK